MPTTRLRAVVVLAFAAGVASLAACGGDSGGGPSFSDSVSTADAEQFASDASDGAVGAMQELNFGEGELPSFTSALATRFAAYRPASLSRLGVGAVPMGTRLATLAAYVKHPTGLQLAAAEGCTITESGIGPGGFVDVNQNGVPDNLLLREECTITDSTSNPDTTTVHYEFVEQHMVERMSALYGFDLSVTEVTKFSDEFGNFELEEIHGSEALDLRAGSASHSIDITEHEAAKFDTATGDFKFGQALSASFVPGSTITLGDPLPDGALTLTGREFVTNTEDVNLSFSLSTTTPLAYSAACAAVPTNPPFTAGVLRGLLNNNSDQAGFTVTFTSCGNATVETNGTHDPVPVARR